MNTETLKSQMEQMSNLLEQNQEWQLTYDEQANILLDNRDTLKQFHKDIKDLEYLQFYITEVCTTPPTLFKITVRYYGADIAIVELTKDEVHITTEPYNKSNKDNFECTLQLKNEEFYSKATNEFLEYFRGANTKYKGNEKERIEGLLLSEFSKTSSAEKLLIGIQPILQQGLIHQIPININKDKPEHISILCRSKVRKITLAEVMEETDTSETVLNRATKYATVLLSLLHSDSGDKYYKLCRISW